MKTRILTTLFSGFILLCSCGDDKEIYEYNYLQIDTSSHTFDQAGEQPFIVNIISMPENWGVEIKADWISELERNEKSATFVAEPNDTQTLRKGTIEIYNEKSRETIQINQLYSLTELTGFRMFPEFEGTSSYVMSHNGRFVASCSYESIYNGDYTWSYLYTPVVIDLETGEVKIWDTSDDRILSMRAVSDDGELMLLAETFKQSSYFKDNIYEQIVFPSEMNPNDSYVDGFSSDGRVIYGYGRKTTGETMYFPIRWVDKVAEIVPYPELDAHGEPIYYGFRVNGISSDGNHMYGSEYGTNTPVHWNFTTNQVNYVGSEHYRKVEGWIDMSDWGYGDVWTTMHNQCEVSFTDMNRMSSNGRYIAMRYYKVDIVDKWYDDYYYPALYDTTTGETTVFWEVENMSGIAVSDDGMMFLHTEEPRTSENAYLGRVLDPETGDITSCSDWIMSNYGIITPEIKIIKVGSNGNILAETKIQNGENLTSVPCVIIPR